MEDAVQEKYDAIIIGGGVVGCMVARWLSRYEMKVLLIEKCSDIGTATSSANTAIVHAGYDPLPGTLKARMNVEGNKMWDQLAGELNFAFERRGDYVVATTDEEFETVKTLMKQGEDNGVPGMILLSGEEVKSREPEITPNVTGALWASTGGICDPFAVTVAAAENAVMNGVKVMLDTAFEDFVMEGKRIVGVKTNKGTFGCRWAINSAGLYSDEVMHKAGVRPEFVIKPRVGEYFVLDRAEITINNVLFPTPTSKGKGILVTTTVHGNTIIGPNSVLKDDKELKAVTREGLNEIWDGALKLVPCLADKRRCVIAVFAGNRPLGNAPCKNPAVKYNSDFIIEIPEEVQGFVNLGGIESPGLTSAPAIAEEVVKLLKEAGEPMQEKADWNPIRIPRIHFRDLERRDQEKLVEKDPRYGRVICRCENVTEGDIIAEIHAPIPATNYDAIKRRTWCGTGRCQGGFDMPRVVAILAKEMGVSPLEISKKGDESKFLQRPTKVTEG